MPSACDNQHRKGNLEHFISRSRFELKLGEVHILFKVNKEYFTLTALYHCAKEKSISAVTIATNLKNKKMY